jgi:hypothetical protein
MKTYCIAVLTLGVLTFGAVAQTSAGASASGSGSVSAGQSGANAGAGANAGSSVQANGASAGNASAGLSSGTTLQAELTKPLDAKKAKAGDEVTAKLTEDVKSDGKVVLHKGSKLVGHVTEAQARGKGESESRLGIAFDRAVLHSGQEVSLGAVVQALAPPASVAASGLASESADAGLGPAGGGRSTGTGGGTLGGAGRPVGSVGSVGNTAGSVAGAATGAAGSTVNGVGSVAGRGALSSTSQGVAGLQGLTLSSATAGSAQGSVISSTTQNVKLDSGTQMLLRVQQ